MKAKPQLSSKHDGRNKFPLIDFHYHSSLETSHAGVTESRRTQRLPAIWKLSAKFFGVEAARDYLTEFGLFSLISGLSAWPIISMLVAVVRMIRNY